MIFDIIIYFLAAVGAVCLMLAGIGRRAIRDAYREAVQTYRSHPKTKIKKGPSWTCPGASGDKSFCTIEDCMSGRNCMIKRGRHVAH